MIEYVFVYGTLKPAHRFHYLCQDMGLASSQKAFIQGFNLFHIDPENYPAIIAGSGTVYGYLLEFEDITKALVALDDLEGVDKNPAHYFREKVKAKPQNVEAWAYVINLAGGITMDRLEPVPSGIWQPKTL